MLLLLALFALVATAAPVKAKGHTDSIFVLSKEHSIAKLEKLLYEEIANPKSEKYAQYLSNEQMRALVRAHPMTVTRMKSKLRKLGFTNIRETEHGDALRAQGPVLKRMPKGVHSMFFRENGKPLKHRGISRRQAIRAMHKGKNVARSQYADPNSQRASYGIPADQAIENAPGTALVWGPGTYGYLPSDLSTFYSEFNVNASTSNIHTTGFQGVPGGDNFGECTLDVSMSTGIGNGIDLSVSNTNTSQSTEEGNGFGYAMMDWVLTLSSMDTPPGVISLSLGSLSAYACETLCSKANSEYGIDEGQCDDYLQSQRQICMMDSMDQQSAIGAQLTKIGLRGTSVFAAAGDGGSHFSFVQFPDDHIGRALNKVSCKYNFPTFPASHPSVVGIGGSQWQGAPSPSQPIAWSSGGSGFSWQFPTPSYQLEAVQAYLAAYNTSENFPSPGSFNAGGRMYPDFVAVASNIPMVEQGQTILEGGTSSASPTSAGLFALINDVRKGKGLPPLGFILPRLYQAKGKGFFDITVGNSACAINGCCTQGFPCEAGFDAMSGFGSPVWSELLEVFAEN